MVKLRDDLPRASDGGVDVSAWLDGLSGQRAQLAAAIDLVQDERALRYGVDVAQMLLELELDADAIAAGLLFEFARERTIDPRAVEARVGAGTAKLLETMLRVAPTADYELSSPSLFQHRAEAQLENVRHLLVSLIDDPRVAAIKLAERLVSLRSAKEAPVETQQRLAEQALRVFAPLAGRLGIGQLKWGLEDIAFRYLHSDEYRKIAASLDARREEREKAVQAAVEELRSRLAKAGVEAEVEGRAKHIYSIWLKMQRKGIGFTEVYDVQAVRVVVERTPQCYAALGVVHTAWPHIPTEFDDYIANPKDNGYRSIHTAVMGPAGRVLEVQIRTAEMHKESELGVCAHWTYKGEEGEAPHAADKTRWLAQVLEWHDEDAVQLEAAEGQGVGDRIYVATPQGHVIDLVQGATPVDFAYRVHTEIGHRCLGARVDGVETALNTPLFTGQTVEIVTGAEENPRREWLNPEAGYAKTARARSKIQAWLREQLAESNVKAGESLLLDALERLDLTVDLPSLAADAGYETQEALLQALGVGECHVIDLVRLVGPRPRRKAEQLSLLPAADGPARSVQRIRITGRNRPGLLRDVSSVVAAMGIDVAGVSARGGDADDAATISLDARVDSVLQLARVIDRIRRVRDVRDVRRG